MRYSALKKMKKSTKVGLASSLAYASLSFITPVLANNVEKPVEQPVLQPLDLTQITTVEQAEQAYNERIKSYAEDKEITSEEVMDLNNILEKKKNMLINQEWDLNKKVYQFENPPDLILKIRKVVDALKELELKEDYNSVSFEKIKQDLDEKVLCYYPSLISKEKNVIYSASDPIEQELNLVMYDLIKRVDKFLKMYYQDATLEFLSEKEEYTVKDVLTFYDSIHKERPAISFNSEELGQKKQKLEDKLKDLTSQVMQQKKSKEKQINELNKKIEDVNVKLRETEEDYNPLKSYLVAKEYVDGFIIKHGNLNKYMSFSFSSVYKRWGFLYGADLKTQRTGFRSRNEQYVLSLKDYFKGKGFDVKIDPLKNPAHTMFPWPWWVNFIFGMVFPMGRNALTAVFVRREFDLFDAFEGILEPFFFATFFDGIHPLVFPLRLFATPFIFEPIRTLTGARDLK